MTRLDIGIIIPELRKYGGAERFLIECLQRWQHKHDITVYSMEFGKKLLLEAGISEIKMREISPRFEGPYATLLNATLLPKMWESEIGKHDIYHSHLWPTHLINVHPVVWFPHEPLRLLYDLRFSQNEEEAADGMQQKLHFYPKETYDSVDGREATALLRTIEEFDQVGKPDRVVANSRFTADYLEQVYKFDVTDVVYPGINAEDFLTLPSENNMVLTIGQLWPHKRIRIIIEAIAQVEDTQLYVVGSGPDRQKLEEIADRLGVADRVFFLHGLENHEVQILLARCLCVVFMPVREPFGIVALEALAAGKPLIAVNEGGFVETLDPSCSVLVPPKPQKISEQIERLKADPELARSMGAHGRNVAKRYTWDKTARDLMTIIEDTHREWKRARPRSRRRNGTTLVASHYFNWYREGFGNSHWCDNPTSGWVTEHPELGYYSSLNGDTIQTHIDQMENAGIDVVIFNLHVNDQGLAMYQMQAAQRFCEFASKRGSNLQFMINMCIYTEDMDKIGSALSIVRDGLISEPGYLSLSGKPALMVFWSGVFDGDAQFISLLRELTEDLFRIGAFMRPTAGRGERRRTLGLFDAITQFSPLELGEPSSWEDVWQQEYDSSAQNSGLFCATVSPGYDDTSLADPNRQRGVRLVPRDGGATYERSWRFVLEQKTPPGLVVISSFNEFHENSHIEPTIELGDAYLSATKSFVTECKSRWKRRGASPAKRTSADAPKNGAGLK